MSYADKAEPTVQQQEVPQPPPLKPREGADEVKPESEVEEQLKEDITFFTDFDEHFGHWVSFPEE